jgi:hypothetical protein
MSCPTQEGLRRNETLSSFSKKQKAANGTLKVVLKTFDLINLLIVLTVSENAQGIVVPLEGTRYLTLRLAQFKHQPCSTYESAGSLKERTPLAD